MNENPNPQPNEEADPLAELRQPFAAEHVGLLPRVTCRACSDSSGKVCDKHKKSECKKCGNWLTSAHMHLEYVGHGAVTDRLLTVDPEWTWEPLAHGENGLPLMATDSQGRPVSLWIKLTVAGVTRLGVGSCPPGQFDPEKVLIGDALRNAAMRFGVALDLWIKGHEDDEKTAAADEREAATRKEPGITSSQLTEMAQYLADLGPAQTAEFQAWRATEGLPRRDRLTRAQADRCLDFLEKLVGVPDASEPGALPLEDGETK